MQTFLIIIHFIVTILLMVVILLQSSKGGGLAGVFGGGAMGTVFGGRGAASFLSKITTVLATIFLVLALLISYIDKGKSSGQSDLADEVRRRQQSSPAAIAPMVPSDETAGDQVNPGAQPAPQDSN